ncbi:MAG: hypothetical protein RL291_119 [Pseudomonadota bacterium]
MKMRQNKELERASGSVGPESALETERLILRGWRESDLDVLAKFYEIDPLAKYVGGPKSREDSWRHMAMIVGHWHLRGYGVFAIEEKASQQTIGWCGPWFPLSFPEPEIGYVLFAPAYRGKGFITEAVAASRTYAYKTLKFRTIVSFIAPSNAASARVAERAGATLEGPAEIRGHTVNRWRYPAPQTIT